MQFVRRQLLRRICLLLVCLYPLLAEPRALWALKQACGIETAVSCTMADCPVRHGGACCCLVKQRMEAKFPALRAFMANLEREERAAAGAECRVKQDHCDGDGGDELPAAGRPHLAPQEPEFQWMQTGMRGLTDRPQAVLEPEPRKILKVPLFS